MNWPGFLIQYNKKTQDYDVVELKDSNSEEFGAFKIDKFVISEKYIIAKAEHGWFAIDRKSLQAWGYYATTDELEKRIGENFGDLTFIEEIPWDYLMKPMDLWKPVSVISIVFIGIILVIGFWPFRKKTTTVKGSR